MNSRLVDILRKTEVSFVFIMYCAEIVAMPRYKGGNKPIFVI